MIGFIGGIKLAIPNNLSFDANYWVEKGCDTSSYNSFKNCFLNELNVKDSCASKKLAYVECSQTNSKSNLIRT